MNRVLWVVQIFLGVVFTLTGLLKIAVPRQKLLGLGQKWVGEFGDGQVKLLGLAEVLGAAGLTAPWGTGILRVLTSLAALGLTALMVGALMTHRRRKEPWIGPLVLASLALLVAIFRGGDPGKW